MNLFNYKKTSKPAAPDTHKRTQRDEEIESEEFKLLEERLNDDDYVQGLIDKSE